MNSNEPPGQTARWRPPEVSFVTPRRRSFESGRPDRPAGRPAAGRSHVRAATSAADDDQLLTLLAILSLLLSPPSRRPSPTGDANRMSEYEMSSSVAQQRAALADGGGARAPARPTQVLWSTATRRAQKRRRGEKLPRRRHYLFIGCYLFRSLRRLAGDTHFIDSDAR